MSILTIYPFPELQRLLACRQERESEHMSGLGEVNVSRLSLDSTPLFVVGKCEIVHGVETQPLLTF